MVENLAPYEEGKYFNFGNMFMFRMVVNAAGLKYFYNNREFLFKSPKAKLVAAGFVGSLTVFDYFMFKEFLRNRDRTDVMFQ